MATSSCPSVTHELASHRGAHGYVGSGLFKQQLRPIPRNASVLAAARGVPYEPHPSYRSAAALDREYSDTHSFLHRTVSADPRLQPADIVVSMDHMSRCTSCVHDQGLNAA